MSLTRADMPEDQRPPRRRKYMCKMQVTNEMIPYLLNIPNADQLRLKTVYEDPSRGIVSFVFEGDGYTQGGPGLRLFEVGEGMEVPNQIIDTDQWVEVMRQKVRNFDIDHGRLTENEDFLYTLRREE